MGGVGNVASQREVISIKGLLHGLFITLKEGQTRHRVNENYLNSSFVKDSPFAKFQVYAL